LPPGREPWSPWRPALGLSYGGVAAAGCSGATQDIVGRVGENRYHTPVNQSLTPAGVQVELPGMRPQALALSPNGRLLVTAGKTHEL